LKAKDLIKILKKNPDYDVSISIDVSLTRDESTYGDRAFCDDTDADYQIVGNTITLMLEGYVNFGD